MKQSTRCPRWRGRRHLKRLELGRCVRRVCWRFRSARRGRNRAPMARRRHRVCHRIQGRATVSDSAGCPRFLSRHGRSLPSLWPRRFPDGNIKQPLGVRGVSTEMAARRGCGNRKKREQYAVEGHRAGVFRNGSPWPGDRAVSPNTPGSPPTKNTRPRQPTAPIGRPKSLGLSSVLQSIPIF